MPGRNGNRVIGELSHRNNCAMPSGTGSDGWNSSKRTFCRAGFGPLAGRAWELELIGDVGKVGSK
jgi:hypothetical protein